MVKMFLDEQFMARCLELAKLGIRNVAPNPMVGSVVVYKNKILGEGYHRIFGGAHAEVEAINSVKDKSLLDKSTLYVNLEPCAHKGKTPPCTDLIISKTIKKVVIACRDSNISVAGKGIKRLTNAGCEVLVGVLEKESRELNRRFFTFYEKHRPYIILKWAQTQDGYFDVVRTKSTTKQPVWISNDQARILVHKWRSEEQAVMVGTNTAENDDPILNVRGLTGKDPLRIVLDKNRRLPGDLKLFDRSVPTILYTEKESINSENLQIVRMNFQDDPIRQILEDLYKREIQSVIIEGGSRLLNSFIKLNLWDEARVFEGNKYFKNGLKAPSLEKEYYSVENIGDNKLYYYRNK